MISSVNLDFSNSTTTKTLEPLIKLSLILGNFQ